MLLLAGVGFALAAQAGAELPDRQAAPAGVTSVYLVRHGQALSNLDPPPDLPPEELDRLTPLGREQACEAGRALALLRVARILTSPADRARETARVMADEAGAVPVRVDRRLRPLELGRSASGQPLDWDDRVADWKAGRDPDPAGGESLGELGRRVLALVREEHARHPGSTVVLVAHSDVIAAFLAVVEGRPGHQAYPFAVRNASLSLVELGPDGAPAVGFVNRLADDLVSPP